MLRNSTLPQKVIIKKHKNKNQYLLTNNKHWVRDFTKKDVPLLDINSMLSEEEYHLMLKNEYKNKKKKYPIMEFETIQIKKAIIVSNGYKFSEYHQILSDLPKDVSVITVNGALEGWKLIGSNCDPLKKKAIHFYVVNNPYNECNHFYPKTTKYFPHCIASLRTNEEFLDSYKGNVFLYCPVTDKRFQAVSLASASKLDDYRNPVCAAISACYKMGVEKLMLFCCDDSFNENRPGSIELENGHFCYPQQTISRELIDAQLHWYAKTGAFISDCSSANQLKNAEKVDLNNVINWFADNNLK